MRMRSCAILVAVVLLTTGCATSQDASDESSTPRPSATSGPATPTPTPTPEAEVKPGLDDLVLTFAGLGSVTLGSDPSTQNASTSIVAPEEFVCLDGSTRTIWRANYPDRPFDNAVAAFELGKVGPEGVHTIHIYAAGPHTEAGIGVGASEQLLLAAYPDIKLSYDNGLWKDFAVSGDSGDLLFRTEDKEGTGPSVSMFGLGPVGSGFPGQQTIASEDVVCS